MGTMVIRTCPSAALRLCTMKTSASVAKIRNCSPAHIPFFAGGGGGQTWGSRQSPLGRRYSRELSQSGIRAARCYDCPTAPCGSGHAARHTTLGTSAASLQTPPLRTTHRKRGGFVHHFPHAHLPRQAALGPSFSGLNAPGPAKIRRMGFGPRVVIQPPPRSPLYKLHKRPKLIQSLRPL